MDPRLNRGQDDFAQAISRHGPARTADYAFCRCERTLAASPARLPLGAQGHGRVCGAGLSSGRIRTQTRLDSLETKLKDDVSGKLIDSTESSVRDSLSKWGQRTALHRDAQAGEIKELLLVLARTAEAVGERDQ